MHNFKISNGVKLSRFSEILALNKSFWPVLRSQPLSEFGSGSFFLLKGSFSFPLSPSDSSQGFSLYGCSIFTLQNKTVNEDKLTDLHFLASFLVVKMSLLTRI